MRSVVKAVCLAEPFLYGYLDARTPFQPSEPQSPSLSIDGGSDPRKTE